MATNLEVLGVRIETAPAGTARLMGHTAANEFITVPVSSLVTHSEYQTLLDSLAGPLAITDIVIDQITATGARIRFNTNRLAECKVVWGTGAAIDIVPPYNYPTETLEEPGGNGLAHTIYLMLPLAGTRYSFRAYAKAPDSEKYSDPETQFESAAVGDLTAPVISGIVATKTATTIRVGWATDDKADSVLEVRTTAGPGAWSVNPARSQDSYILVNNHSLEAIGLTPNTSYDYRVTSINASSLPTVSSIGTITTDAVASTTILDADFTTNDLAKVEPLIASPGAGVATTTVTGGEAIVTLSTGANSNAHQTTNPYDANNKEFIAHVTLTYAGVGGGPATRFIVGKSGDTTQELGLIQDNGNIYPFYRRDGIETIDFAQGGAYVQANEPYWRIRLDTVNSVVIFDTDDNLAFTSPRLVGTISFATAINAANWSLTSSKARFQAGTFTASGTSWAGYGPAKISRLLINTLASGGGGTPPPPESSTYPPQITIISNGTTWNWVDGNDFLIPVPEGSAPGAAYSSQLGYYTTGWPDSSRNGYYDTPRVNSVVVANGEHFLRYHIRTVNGLHLVSAPQWKPNSGALSMRFSQRWRCGNIPTYKIADLGWPTSETWPRDGELDFVEGNFDGNVEWYMHRQNGANGGDQDYGNSGVKFANTGWHISTFEWIAGVSWRVWLDGVQVGSTITSRVPNTPFRWSLQKETNLSGVPVNSAADGNFDVDWYACWVKA